MGTTPPSSTDHPIATNSMTETESSTGTIETTLSNEVPLTNSPTTSTGNDSITMAPLAPADNAGVVAGVVVFLLVVIVVAVVILVVIFVLVKRGRSRKEITVVGNIGRNTNTGTNNGMGKVFVVSKRIHMHYSTCLLANCCFNAYGFRFVKWLVLMCNYC